MERPRASLGRGHSLGRGGSAVPKGRKRVATSKAEPLDFRTYSLRLQAWPMLWLLLTGQEDHLAGGVGKGGQQANRDTATYLVWRLLASRG